MLDLTFASPPRIAILISGRGSNMAALLKARPLGGPVVGVLSSRADAPGLATAEAAGVPTAVVASSDYRGDREGYDTALAAALDAWQVDVVVLAGFMRILTDRFVERYPWRMLNIHPSLLPVFPGLDPHGQAIRAGVKLSGVTVHFVVPGAVDAGPIIAQTAVPVLPGDDPDTLAARVLIEEHRLYPQVIRDLLAGRYRVADGIVERR